MENGTRNAAVNAIIERAILTAQITTERVLRGPSGCACTFPVSSVRFFRPWSGKGRWSIRVKVFPSRAVLRFVFPIRDSFNCQESMEP